MVRKNKKPMANGRGVSDKDNLPIMDGQGMFESKKPETVLFERFWSFLLYEFEAEEKEIRQEIQEDRPEARARNKKLLKKIKTMGRVIDMIKENQELRPAFFPGELEEMILENAENIKKVLKLRHSEAKLIKDWYKFMNVDASLLFVFDAGKLLVGGMKVNRFKKMVEAVIADECLRNKTMDAFWQILKGNYNQDIDIIRYMTWEEIGSVKAQYAEAKRIVAESMLKVVSVEEVMKMSSADTIGCIIEILMKNGVEGKKILEVLKRSDDESSAVIDNLGLLVDFVSIDDILSCSRHLFWAMGAEHDDEEFRALLKTLKENKVDLNEFAEGIWEFAHILVTCFQDMEEAGIEKEILIEKIVSNYVGKVLRVNYEDMDKKVRRLMIERKQDFAPYVRMKIADLPRIKVIKFFEVPESERIVEEEELVEILKEAKE